MGQKLTSGSLDFLKTAKKVQVQFVYNQATINKKDCSIREYAEMIDSRDEESVGTFMRELDDVCSDHQNDFVALLNEKIPRILFGPGRECNYKLTCYLVRVDPKGQNALFQFVFTDNQDKTLAVIETMKKGGRWGTFTNLLGDSYRDARDGVANMIRKAAK